MATTFTRMDESTAEQWAVIGKETFEHQGRVADRVLRLLESLAEITDGFATDQLTHCLQTATRAERADTLIVLLLSIACVMIIVAHRSNLAKDFAAIRARRAGTPAGGTPPP